MRQPHEELDTEITVIFPNGYRGRLAHLIGWSIGQFHRDEEHESNWGVYDQLMVETKVAGGEAVTATRATFVRASYLFLQALAGSSTAGKDWWEIHRFLIKALEEQAPAREAGFY